MDWIVSVGETWLTTLAWVAGLSAAFAVLARLMPCNPGMYWWKDVRAVATDFMYWFIMPFFIRACRIAMWIGAVTLFCNGQEPGSVFLRSLPLWQQCLGMLIIQGCTGGRTCAPSPPISCTGSSCHSSFAPAASPCG